MYIALNSGVYPGGAPPPPCGLLEEKNYGA